MKFRQRKKNFLNRFGRTATVYCNHLTKFQPIAEFLNKTTEFLNKTTADLSADLFLFN